MTDVLATQGFVLATGIGLAGGLSVTQSNALVVAQSPAADSMRVEQAFTGAAVRFDLTVKVPQAFVLVAVKGRVVDPRIRAWTFTLDGKDFYVLRIGATETLIYDLAADQWYVWGSAESDVWKAYCGCNWIGAGPLPHTYGSNIVVGDDVNGALYFLDPENSYDDNNETGSADPEDYIRRVTGQIAVRGRDRQPCYAVQLYGSLGDVSNVLLTDVQLDISDDNGNNYTDCGAVTITPTDYDARAEWRSLGSMVAPGRLFRITDYGAVHRIDGLEIKDVSEPN